jgi:hypothetical protein
MRVRRRGGGSGADCAAPPLAGFLRGAARNHRAMILLQAYFDESGLHQASPATLIAGFVGRAEDWLRVETEWRAALAPHGITEFHYHEFENRTGPWEPMERWCRDPIRDALAGIIGKSPLIPIGFGFVGEWEPTAVTHPLWKPESYPTAYSWCFEGSMNLLVRCCREVYASQPVTVIFAQHEQFAERALREFDKFKRNHRWETLVDPIVLGSPSKVPALQMADMLAYELYQALRKNRDKRFTWPLLDALWSRDPTRRILAMKYTLTHDAATFKETVKNGPHAWLAHDPPMLERETVVYLSGQPIDPDPWIASPEGLDWWKF